MLLRFKSLGGKVNAVMLDGVRIEVTWDDGDTFHGKRADGSKIKARLNGYNTLGPMDLFINGANGQNRSCTPLRKSRVFLPQGLFGNARTLKRVVDTVEHW